MQVKATRMGYDGERRWREGQVFELKDPAKFSPSWMEKVGESKESDSSSEPVLSSKKTRKTNVI